MVAECTEQDSAKQLLTRGGVSRIRSTSVKRPRAKGVSVRERLSGYKLRLKPRSTVLGLAAVVLIAGGIILGSYALVASSGHEAAGQSDGSVPAAQAEPTQESAVTEKPAVVETVVSRIKDTGELDAGLAVITVPLGADWKKPGCFYASGLKERIQLGPAAAKGMTQDAFSGQAGILLPDERHLLYHFWEQLADFPTEVPGDPIVKEGTHLSTPTIRLHDLETGEDSLLVAGARSFAWRADGMFAYAQGVDRDYRYNIPYLQRVVVQKGLNGTPEVWTKDADGYTVLEWAGEHLLVWREIMEGAGELLVFAGPNQARSIPEMGERFLGTSTDGSFVLATSGPDAGYPYIRLINLETGGEVTRLSLEGVSDPQTGAQVTTVTAAALREDKLMAAVSPADLAVFEMGKTNAGPVRLVFKEIIKYTYPGLCSGTADDLLWNEAAGRLHFVVRESSGNGELARMAVITYDLDSGECLRWVAPDEDAVVRLVTKASRPQ